MKIQSGLLACAILTLVACAQTGSPDARTARAGASNACFVSGAEQELLLNLSQEMVTEGRLHATLANLEQLPPAIPQVQLRKAEVLRVLAKERAKKKSLS